MTATDDTVEQFLSDRERLPKMCPGWCGQHHVQALEEGNPLDASSVHVGPDYSLPVKPIGRTHDVEGGVHTQLRADPWDTFWNLPLIHLDVHEWQGGLGRGGTLRRIEVPLTSGQARVLARQLLHLADLIDLD